jgi:hypothetical protein
MSAYKDFVSDFPARCLDILRMAEKPARVQQREVTLALLVASAGFVVPFERLGDHPTGDATRYAEASRKLNGLLTEKFLSSALATGATSWCGGKLASVSGDPDSWPEMTQPKKLSGEKTVRGVVKVVRDALAHGNIFTHGDQISKIIFVHCHYVYRDGSKEYKEADFITASPDDFLIFLKAWFEFLKSENIPAELTAQSISNAA